MSQISSYHVSVKENPGICLYRIQYYIILYLLSNCFSFVPSPMEIDGIIVFCFWEQNVRLVKERTQLLQTVMKR